MQNKDWLLGALMVVIVMALVVIGSIHREREIWRQASEQCDQLREDDRRASSVGAFFDTVNHAIDSTQPQQRP